MILSSFLRVQFHLLSSYRSSVPLPRRDSSFAAAGLSIIMVGALYTTASHHMYKESITPVIVFTLLIWVANTRMKEAKNS